jgi:hypothetical protein
MNNSTDTSGSGADKDIDRKSSKKKKKSAAPAASTDETSVGTPSAAASGAATTRESVRTVADRLKELPELPSLQAAPVGGETPENIVETNAAPPPAPPPAPDAEPAPMGMIDRGSPIPDHYGMDRLVVLPRDPHWLCVYWELKGGALDRLRFQHSAEVIDNSRWVLRVRGMRDTSQYLVDIDLRAGQWYLKVAPNSRFSTELGFINPQGDFIRLLRGNESFTPGASVSNVVDERWIILRDELERLLKTGGVDAPGIRGGAFGGSEAAPPMIRSEQPRALGLFSSHSFVNPDREKEGGAKG